MVPNGWVEGKVNDLLQGLESGVSVNGTERKVGDNEKAVLKVSAVSYGIFDPFALKVIEDIQELSRAKVNPKAGQIIISRSNTENLVGASAYIDQNYPNLFLPDKLWQTIPKPNTDMKWLSYVLASKHARYTLSKLATGTSGSMKNITQDELLSLKILIPPLLEQNKISQVLSTWDQTISATEKLLENSQQQKKALMQQLLTGKKRLLDENSVKFSEEWKTLSLDSLFIFKKGKGLSKDSISESGQNKCILYGELYTKYPEVIDEIVSKTNSSEATLSIKGDILIPSSTTTSGIDLANATALLEENILLGGDINILRPKGEISSEFMAYLLTHIKKYEIASRAQGITIIHLYGSDLKDIEVKIPVKVEEQEKIAKLLSIVEKKINALQGKIVCLKKEKKALMQQLLTGKKRVKVAA